MRIKELAEKLGVSTYTVSVALSGKSGVSEATRKRVVEAAARNVSSFGAMKKKIWTSTDTAPW